MLLSLLKQKAKKDDDDGLGMYSGVLSNKGVYIDIDTVKFDVFRLLMIRSALLVWYQWLAKTAKSIKLNS